MKTGVLPFRIKNKIQRSRQNVFVPADFAALSGYVQVLRVLKQMVDKGELIKLGQGIYAKSSKRNDGKIVPAGSIFLDIIPTALKKFGIKILPSRAAIAYNSGKSTQLPTGRVMGVNKRVRRSISYNGVKFKFQTISQRELI